MWCDPDAIFDSLVTMSTSLPNGLAKFWHLNASPPGGMSKKSVFSVSVPEEPTGGVTGPVPVGAGGVPVPVGAGGVPVPVPVGAGGVVPVGDGVGVIPVVVGAGASAFTSGSVA